MSKNITIQEGGVGKQLTVDKLKTNLVGGGTCLWLPEDEVLLGQKTINANGTYKASDDGLYGYSQVTVRNAGIASGKIARGATLPTGDDNEYAVTTDDSGNLTFQKVPSSIQVTTLPNTITYDNGDTINYTGMVVTMYDANDQSMGTVPIGELTLPDTVADNTALEKLSESAASNVDISPLPNPIEIASSGHCYSESYGTTGIHYFTKETITPASGIDVAFITVSMSDNDVLMRGIFASDTPGEIVLYHYERYGIDRNGNRVHETEENQFISTNAQATINGKTVYYRSDRSNAIGNTDHAVDCNYPHYILGNNQGDIAGTAWTMIYGTRTVAGYKVRVLWQRTGDNKVLETSFNININDD